MKKITNKENKRIIWATMQGHGAVLCPSHITTKTAAAKYLNVAINKVYKYND